jgi:hypothetical protein
MLNSCSLHALSNGHEQPKEYREKDSFGKNDTVGTLPASGVRLVEFDDVGSVL